MDQSLPSEPVDIVARYTIEELRGAPMRGPVWFGDGANGYAVQGYVSTLNPRFGIDQVRKDRRSPFVGEFTVDGAKVPDLETAAARLALPVDPASPRARMRELAKLGAERKAASAGLTHDGSDDLSLVRYVLTRQTEGSYKLASFAHRGGTDHACWERLRAAGHADFAPMADGKPADDGHCDLINYVVTPAGREAAGVTAPKMPFHAW